ncbi:MAG: 2'-5' RNA ligase family protein [Acidobacteriia bacterium]|nr:2'-5' RNA ligase family protein [Terriglobia bacterium]
MGLYPNGGHQVVSADERLNIFALVIYIPDPLGRFLDDLRREVAPGCDPHAHVSVLPPRSLAGDWREASEEARALTEGMPSFEIELNGLKQFPVTEVVYIELGKGASELHELHANLNSGALKSEEPFTYHPHVTLAQEIPRGDVAAVYSAARRRWNEYRGPRRFRVERAVFVQGTMENRWIDLAEYCLGGVAVR